MNKFTVYPILFLLASISINGVFGQNETTQTEINRPISHPEPIPITESFLLSLEFITVVSAIINVVLVFFIFLTFRENKMQFSSINRPWINIQRGTINPFDEMFEVIVKNHGNLPAKNMNVTFKDLSENELKIKELHSPIHSLMPSQEQSAWLPVMKTYNYPTKVPNRSTIKCEYHVEITITFSYEKQNKKVIFEMVEDQNLSDNGPFIKTTFMD